MIEGLGGLNSFMRKEMFRLESESGSLELGNPIFTSNKLVVASADETNVDIASTT